MRIRRPPASRIAVAAVVSVAALAGLVASVAWGNAPEQAPVQRDFEVTARKYEFAPARIEVTQDDLVKVTLHSSDIPHSFTVDAYRIAKRVGGGQSVTFEFRADQPGTFPIYCNLKQDDGCRQMRGTLVVRPRS